MTTKRVMNRRSSLDIRSEILLHIADAGREGIIPTRLIYAANVNGAHLQREAAVLLSRGYAVKLQISDTRFRYAATAEGAELALRYRDLVQSLGSQGLEPVTPDLHKNNLRNTPND